MDTLTELLQDPDALTLLGAIAAWLAALAAFRSSRAASKSLELQRARDAKAEPDLTTRLIDASIRRSQLTDSRSAEFLVVIANRSSAQNTLVQIDLQITYRLPTGQLVTIKLPAQNNTQVEGYGQKIIQPSEIVPAFGAIQGLVAFDLHPGLLGEGEVDSYELVVVDVHGQRISEEVILIREVVDEQEIKKDKEEEGEASA